jgi:hypothetical protein
MSRRQTYSGAALNVVTTNGVSVVHGVESGNLVDTHGGHFQSAGDLVHDADAAETVLALAKVEQGHDGSLLVLRRVSAEDFLDELLILGIEGEGDVEVVLWCVTVLVRKRLEGAGWWSERRMNIRRRGCRCEKQKRRRMSGGVVVWQGRAELCCCF